MTTAPGEWRRESAVGEGALVRRARESDLDALVDLREEMFRAMGVPTEDDAWRGPAKEWFRGRLADPAYGIFVVEAAGEPAACAMGAIRDGCPAPGDPRGRDIVITNVCTFPSQRGRGYARAAFDAVMAWAKQSGVSKIELFATPAGAPIYAAHGFTVPPFPAMRVRLGD